MPPQREGETSYYETAFGIIPRSKLIPLEIEGIKRAWNFVLQKHARGKIPITAEFLKEVHFVGFGWIFPDMGGKFRTVELEVSNHRPPRFYLVPQLMLDFCRDLEERLRHLPFTEDVSFLGKLIELLAWSHHRFLWIHPFKDYNGRIGRLLMSMILLNLDFPPIELKVETRVRRRKYVVALQSADKGDFTPLEKLIKEAIQEAAKEV